MKKIFLLILCIISFLWMSKAIFLDGYPDFKVHYYGAQHLLKGENPYISDSNYFTTQVYPPFDMVFFIPFSLMPIVLSEKLWTAISILSILTTVFLLSKILNISFFSNQNLILLTLTMISFPTKFTLGMGQVNSVILLFITYFIYLYLNKKYLISAATLSIPILIKFFPLLIIPYLLVRKKIKLLIYIFIFILLFTIISLYFYPIPVMINYFQTTLPDLINSWKGEYYNQSLMGFLFRSVDDQSIRSIIKIVISISLIIFTFTVLFFRREKKDKILLEIGSVLTLSLLINNFSWQHHFIWLVLPFYFTYFYLHNHKKNIIHFIILVISYLLISINLQNPNNFPVTIQSHVFYGCLIFYLHQSYLIIKK